MEPEVVTDQSVTAPFEHQSYTTDQCRTPLEEGDSASNASAAASVEVEGQHKGSCMKSMLPMLKVIKRIAFAGSTVAWCSKGLV